MAQSTIAKPLFRLLLVVDVGSRNVPAAHVPVLVPHWVVSD